MDHRFLRFVAFAGLLAFANCTSPSREPRSAAARATPARIEGRAPIGPRDAYVLLSGGGTPLTNHYSQYVQARALAGWLERTFPPESTWIFFGAGNRAGAPTVLADVRRDTTRDGLAVSSWLPGVLPRNRPATRESFLRAMREEILPSVRGGGTLFLFVGDHGELAGGRDNSESAITLWQMKRGRRRSAGWITDAKEVLGVAELRRVLAEGLGAGRVVFCMTQCHGGGFHELGIAREMQPPGEWFASPPAGPAGPGLRLPVAGYTATDEASPAAGCDPDPNPERWAGYERFLPESLLGLDLLSGRPKGAPAMSFAEAHRNATLVDHTIDKPRSTAEHYLAAWADAIEARVAKTLMVTPEAARALDVYQRAVDTGNIGRQEPALRERQVRFQRFGAALAEQLPAAAPLLASGTREQLRAAIEERARGPRGPRRGALAELRRAWTDQLRPAWKAAVLGGALGELRGPVLEFERHLLALEDDGENFLLPRGGDSSRLLNEVYWSSGYANPASVDEPAAQAVAAWGASRRNRIVEWGRMSADPAVRQAATRIGLAPSPDADARQPLTRNTAAERVLFYRRVLAAWEFLLNLNATAPLAELETLLRLETTPVPGAAPVAAR